MDLGDLEDYLRVLEDLEGMDLRKGRFVVLYSSSPLEGQILDSKKDVQGR